MGTGEWFVWAADGGAGGTSLWATLLVAVIAVAGPVLTYLATKRNINTVRLSAIEANSTANRAVEQARDAANQSDETARQANTLAASRSNREAIMMLERGKPEVVERDWAIPSSPGRG